MEEPVGGIIECTTEGRPRPLHEDLAQRRRHALGAIPALTLRHVRRIDGPRPRHMSDMTTFSGPERVSPELNPVGVPTEASDAPAEARSGTVSGVRQAQSRRASCRVWRGGGRPRRRTCSRCDRAPATPDFGRYGPCAHAGRADCYIRGGTVGGSMVQARGSRVHSPRRPVSDSVGRVRGWCPIGVCATKPDRNICDGDGFRAPD